MRWLLLALALLGAAPQDPPAAEDWKRLQKVERWILEYAVRCDDQHTWQKKGGDRGTWTVTESMVQTVELTRNSRSPRWSGTAEANLKCMTYSRTDYVGGEYHWNRYEGGGKITLAAELDIIDEKGYKFRLRTTKDTVEPEGQHTGEYHQLTGKGWVTDARQNATKIYAPAHFKNGPRGHQPYPEKGLVLAGSRPLAVADDCRDKSEMKFGMEHPHHGSWRWRIVPAGTELVDVEIDPPADYDTWLPAAGETEAKAGSHMEVTARLVTRDGKPPQRKAKKFVFELNDVSTEPGTSMNWPLKNAAATPDLAFEPDVSRLKTSSDMSLRGETADGEHIAATGIVSCFDFGAYGEVQVTAEMDDGERIVGYVKGDPTRSSLAIPRREGGSRIAAAWKRPEGLADGDDSENEPVGDGFRGDGLTLYEEYRGFVDRRGHRRVDPLKKELFVSDHLGGVDAAFTHYEKITGFVVRLLPKETRDDRVINFNRSAASPQRCEQHLVILGGASAASDHKSEFAGGSTVRENNGRAKVTPVSVKRIVVKARADEKVKALGAAEDYSYRQVVIVHELLHATGVEHHGDGDTLSGVTWSRDPDASRVLEGGKAIEVFRESATPVPLKSHDDLFDNPFDVVLAVQNGAFSGDQSCIMRYAGPGAYVHPDNRSTKRFFIAHEPAEAWGLGLCTSPDGTGVNPARYGKATRGNCAGQLRVSDAP
jgi:hypothetical protein